TVGCFAAYYDISKAYDTIRWSSIEHAMRNLGLEEDFITFVMQSLKGTRVAMRTNIHGRITRTVTLHKSIKQGCPLAPLLFIIVMDEMHKNLRKLGLGYTLANGHKVSSRGYCDDTYIVANSIQHLRRMNDEVIAPFFEKHGLCINEEKTKVTGRHPCGTPYTNTMAWPCSGKPFETVPPDKTVRYLGAHINMDLNWRAQINRMQASVMTTAAHIKSKRLTAFQGIAITRHVIGSRLEIGMRHASIPEDTLRMWDDTIASAISQRSGLTRLHKTSTEATLLCSNICPFSHQYMLTKVAHIMEMVTKRSELKDHYRARIEPIIATINQVTSANENTLPSEAEINRQLKQGPAHWPTVAKDLARIAASGISIRKTQRSVGQREKAPAMTPINMADFNPLPGEELISRGTATFKDIKIPWKTTHDLWGAAFDKAAALLPLLSKDHTPKCVRTIMNADTKTDGKRYHHPNCQAKRKANQGKLKLKEALGNNYTRSSCQECKQHWGSLDDIANKYIMAVICTDGSTYPGRNSAAAFVLAEDGIEDHDLWDTPGTCWRLSESNNYLAEMAAAHRAIRAVPVNVNLTVHTDSLGAILAIKSALVNPYAKTHLRSGARPYLMAIVRAILAREKSGATTSILHVRAHTGGRTVPEIGNACADHLAKWMALAVDEGTDPSHLDLNQADHPHVVVIQKLPPDTMKEIQGDTNLSDLIVNPTAIHGDIRKACKEHLNGLHRIGWAMRGPTRGKLIREYEQPTMEAIKRVHAFHKNSAGEILLQDSLQNITMRTLTDGESHKETCSRCGTKAIRTFQHRAHACPSNADDLEALDQEITRHTGYANDPEIGGPRPTSLLDRTEATRKAIVAAITDPTLPLLAIKQGRSLKFTTPERFATRWVDSRECPGPIHTYALLHTLAHHRKTKIDGPQSSPSSHPDNLGVNPGAIRHHINHLMRQAHARHPQICSPPIREASRVVLRTYSDLHYNPLLAEAPWEDTWMGSNQECWRVGADMAPSKEHFLKNRYTWINFNANVASQLEDIHLAIEAITSSDGPARAAILTRHANRLSELMRNHNNTKRARLHILLTIQPNAKITRAQTLDNYDDSALRSHDLPLCLLVIDNALAPDYDHTHMAEATKHYPGITAHEPPWTHWN
ncbi:MAG: reverse transcriptase domain-containing protein, partial [Burkholderiaceae bacterium]